jgi:acid stress-induced BolA-like protein IbaG/YrbA
MPTTEWLESEIKSILPNSQVEAIDLHGTMDHFHIRIIDESFADLRPLQRQKLILNHFREHIPSPIHAIDLKCMTPAQAQISEDTVFDPHGGGTGIHIKRIQKHQTKE